MVRHNSDISKRRKRTRIKMKINFKKEIVN